MHWHVSLIAGRRLQGQQDGTSEADLGAPCDKNKIKQNTPEAPHLGLRGEPASCAVITGAEIRTNIDKLFCLPVLKASLPSSLWTGDENLLLHPHAHIYQIKAFFFTGERS